jgi:hypothetical protein
MIIHLNEHRFSKLFLTESKNSKRADKQTMQLIAQRSGWDINDERVLQAQRYFRSTYFGSEGVNVDWFIVLEPNFCAAAIDKGLLRSGDVYSNEVYNDLLDLIKYAYRKAKGLIETKGREAMLQYIAELRGNVVGWDTLYEMVGKALENERQEAMEKANQAQESESEYEVIGPVDFNEASEYGDYTAYQDGGEICYTQGGQTWNSYTHNDEYAVYILVKPNWDELEPVHDDEGEESAYDTYGMSMIFVIVDENGNLKTCNTRWNHEAIYRPDYDVDFALDETELSELVGRPFSEVFKPKNPMTFEEKAQMILDKINDDNDENVDEYFNYFEGNGSGRYVVELGDYWNYLVFDPNNSYYHYLFDNWFSSDDDLEYEVMKYNRNEALQRLEDGEDLDEIFDNYEKFGEVYIVELDGYYNFLGNSDNFLFDNWFDYCEVRDNYAIVTICEQGTFNCSGNLVNQKGELLWHDYTWFEDVRYRGNNFFVVELYGKYNAYYNGALILNEPSYEWWFDDVDFNKNGFDVFYYNKMAYIFTNHGLEREVRFDK